MNILFYMTITTQIIGIIIVFYLFYQKYISSIFYKRKYENYIINNHKNIKLKYIKKFNDSSNILNNDHFSNTFLNNKDYDDYLIKNIKSILNNNLICFTIKNGIIVIPYEVNKIPVIVDISFKNNLILMNMKVTTNKNIDWCNNFNSIHTISKAYIDNDNYLVLTSVLDLNIFSVKKLNEWFKTTLFVNLKTIKTEILD